jgi:hypothetical protein
MRAPPNPPAPRDPGTYACVDRLNALDHAAGRQVGDDTEVDDQLFAELFNAAEQLRLHLAADVGTGQRPRIPSAQLRPAKSPDIPDG